MGRRQLLVAQGQKPGLLKPRPVAGDNPLMLSTRSALGSSRLRGLMSGPLLAACALVPALRAASPGDAAPPMDHETRIAWFRQAKFGLFIHWGLYSIPAGEWEGKPVPGLGEWIMNHAQIPVKEYEQLATQFNPVKFNAEQWVKMAEDAGMKYIVITSKHHDGFAMYHSQVSKYNIYDATPFHRDVIKELAQACAKHGI